LYPRGCRLAEKGRKAARRAGHAALAAGRWLKRAQQVQRNTMETIRIGVIGAGQIGTHHLNEYAQIPEAQLVAVADPVGATLEAARRKFSIQHGYSDYREMLRRDDIDAVDVCVHNAKHAPITIEALKAGKHVYCEKPMAGTWRDALAMAQAAEKCGRKLHIQLGTLYTVETRAARRLIDEGHLGKVYYARSFGYRRRGRPFVDGYGTANFVDKSICAGGALYDMGVYHIAQVLYLIGNPAVLTISGATHQELEMYEDRRSFSNYSVEELGLGLVRLEGGITLDIEESWAIHHDGQEASKILGSRGGLRLNPLTYFSSLGDMPGSTTFDLKSTDTRWHACFPQTAWHDSSQRHWISALLGRAALLPTAPVALNTALISEGIYLSSRMGREVTAADVRDRSVSATMDPLAPEKALAQKA
jgi:predicted dehydrogenase